MEKVLQSYLRRLSNLSGNNRSLLLLKLISEQFIDIHDLDYADGQPSFQVIKDLMLQKKKISLCSEVDSRSKSTNELSTRLKKISRRERFIFEERGAKDLYVGWPFIKGKFSDGTPVRCPLIFFPVSIEKEGNEWFLSRREDVNITLNKTFFLAYSYYNDIKLDEEIIETVIDDYEKDDLAFRTQLYDLLKNSKVEINFNQENFSDELKTFKSYRKSEFEDKEKVGILKMFPEAVLGIFPQAGSYLVPDYQKLLEEKGAVDLEDFFAKKIKSDINQMSLFSDKVNEENTFTPFPLDAYQEKAIKQVKRGNSVVIQGPPGTGKSQLISNLICDFIARGKNVLLVCQKKAALDVVYSRLKEKELHDFVALVHDFKNDRKSIFEKIDQQIESVETYEKKNNSLDSIQLERNFLQASRKIDQLSEELQEFRDALFDEGECGKSVKELYLTSSPDRPCFSLNLEYRAFHFEHLPEALRRLKTYLTYHSKFEQRNHFWAKGSSFSDFQTKDLIKIQEVLHSIRPFYEQLIEKSKEFALRKIDFDSLEYFSGKATEIKQLHSELKEKILFKVYKQLHDERPTKNLPWLIQLEKSLLSCFKGVGVESSLKASELGRFQEVLQSGIKARNRPWSWIKWSFSKEKTFLKRVLIANQLKSNKRSFNVLVERIDNRLNYEHIASQIAENSWLHNFPGNFRKIEIQDWFFWQKAGLNAYYLRDDIRALHEYISIKNVEQDVYLKGLSSLKDLSNELPKHVGESSRYFTIHQIKAVVLEKEDPTKLERLLKKDFDAICEFHKLKTDLSSEESRVIDKVIEANVEIDEALDLFTNSLSLAWIDHIEGKYPDLRSVSSGKLDRQIEEYHEAIETKRSSSKEILLLKAREKTYEDLEFNRLKNRVTYRDLQHQVTKKRRIWPIRRVISEFTDELFTLLPCWMCSPESASAIFPMQEHFDLVIFDEASQCFAERGIPAMYRGKQIVVTGDSKQLQPSDLYRVRWEEDDDTTPELSIDSLLDLTKHFLPEISLSGHYRSKSLELIDFSNEHFYGGKLRLLPDFKYVNKKEPAIKYIASNGVWEDGMNTIEGEKVVDLVFQWIKGKEKKDIGIVTFNHKQQELIMDILEQRAEQENVLIPSSLFVKNIENVQGDERDIIIFSVGYAPDKKGKIKLQFGSLNVEGGENRLNVAVTRAREMVFVLSSIHPSNMQTGDTKNEGPKLLKKYLEYAWNVSNGKWKPHLPEYEDHPSGWYLRSQLKEESFYDLNGFKLEKELPFSDLSVRVKEEYTGLILTDDERYYQALSPKQIYAFQHFHLTTKNWKYVRFHSREIWIDPDSAKEKMQKFLYKAR